MVFENCFCGLTTDLTFCISSGFLMPLPPVTATGAETLSPGIAPLSPLYFVLCTLPGPDRVPSPLTADSASAAPDASTWDSSPSSLLAPCTTPSLYNESNSFLYFPMTSESSIKIEFS